MGTWVDPRPNDFTEGGLRARLKSLQDWLADPEFNDGVRLGSGAAPTYNSSTGVSAPPVPTAVTSENVALFAQDAIQSDNYDGTTVAAADATVGWRLERDTGSIDAGDARIRGDITAERLRTVSGANIMENSDFAANVSNWTLTQSTGNNLSMTWEAGTGDSSAGQLRITRSTGGTGPSSAGEAFIESAAVACDEYRAYVPSYSHKSSDGNFLTSAMYVDWYDASNVLIGTVSSLGLWGPADAGETPGNNGYTRHTNRSIVAPQGSTTFRLRFDFFNMSDTSIVKTMDYDDVMLTEAPTVVGGHIQSSEASPFVSVPTDSLIEFSPDGRKEFPVMRPYIKAVSYEIGTENEDQLYLEFSSGQPHDDVDGNGDPAELQLMSGSIDGTKASEVTITADQFWLNSTNVLGAWKAYTPTFRLGANTVTVGDGSVVGRYMQIGKTVHFYAQLNVGATTSWPANDTLTASLPVAGARTTIGGLAIGNASGFDNSINRNGLASVVVEAHRVGMYGFNDAFATATAPLAMSPSAAGKYIIFTGTYEAA